jgi:hypothetical protein
MSKSSDRRTAVSESAERAAQQGREIQKNERAGEDRGRAQR